MKIGESIKAAREVKKLSPVDLAAKLSVTTLTVADWESGDLTPTPDEIKKIAEALGIDPAQLENNETPKERICCKCGKILDKDEVSHQGTKLVTFFGRKKEKSKTTYHIDEKGHDIFCDRCAQELILEHNRKVAEVKKAAWIASSIVGGLALVICVVIGVLMLLSGNQMGGIIALSISPVVAYAFFALIFVLTMGNTFVGHFFKWAVFITFIQLPSSLLDNQFDGIGSLIAGIILKIIVGILLFFVGFALILVFSLLCSLVMFFFARRREPDVD